MQSQKRNLIQEVREQDQHHHQEEVSLYHQQTLMDLLHLGPGISEIIGILLQRIIVSL